MFAKLYLDLFKFDVSIVQCLGVYFCPDTVYYQIANLNHHHHHASPSFILAQLLNAK